MPPISPPPGLSPIPAGSESAAGRASDPRAVAVLREVVEALTTHAVDTGEDTTQVAFQGAVDALVARIERALESAEPTRVGA